jgi:hypothetical protein
MINAYEIIAICISSFCLMFMGLLVCLILYLGIKFIQHLKSEDGSIYSGLDKLFEDIRNVKPFDSENANGIIYDWDKDESDIESEEEINKRIYDLEQKVKAQKRREAING